jgi:hypothetical protein
MGGVGGGTGVLVLMWFFMNPLLIYAWGALVLWITFMFATPLVAELKTPYEMARETTRVNV